MNGKKISIYVMEIMAALMGIVSAYGSSCPAFDPEKLLIVDAGETLSENSQILYGVITQFQWVFYLAIVLSYAAGVFSLIMIWALAKRKSWFYTTALITALVGFISGFTPWFLIFLQGGSTPSYVRTAIYGILIVLLLLPPYKKAFKDNIANSTVSDTSSTTTSGDLSAFFFFPGMLLWIQSLLAAPSHIFNNVDVYMLKAVQIGLGLMITAIGIGLFAISKLRHPTD
ncbi:MAG: hypothetical protein ACTSYI_07210 [Promethearchaeota archaeon]